MTTVSSLKELDTFLDQTRLHFVLLVLCLSREQEYTNQKMNFAYRAFLKEYIQLKLFLQIVFHYNFHILSTYNKDDVYNDETSNLQSTEMKSFDQVLYALFSHYTRLKL